MFTIIKTKNKFQRLCNNINYYDLWGLDVSSNFSLKDLINAIETINNRYAFNKLIFYFTYLKEIITIFA